MLLYIIKSLFRLAFLNVHCEVARSHIGLISDLFFSIISFWKFVFYIENLEQSIVSL